MPLKTLGTDYSLYDNSLQIIHFPTILLPDDKTVARNAPQPPHPLNPLNTLNCLNPLNPLNPSGQIIHLTDDDGNFSAKFCRGIFWTNSGAGWS